MEVKSDDFVIHHTPRDEQGKQLAPEEMPAERVLTVDVPVSAGGQQVGSLATGEVRFGGTALGFATEYRKQCGLCLWFDNAGFREMKRRLEAGPKDDQGILNNLRAMLLSSGNAELQRRSVDNDQEMDVEHALSVMGLCPALKEVFGDVCVVHPLGCCPPGPAGEDLSGLFQPKSIDAERAGIAGYDAILKMAEGKFRR